MIAGPQLTAVVGLTILAFLALVWATGGTVSLEWLKYLSATLLVVTGALAAFDNLLWRIPFLQGWFVRRPHLSGVWDVTIRTGWKDPATGEQIGPVRATFEITQTYATLNVQMKSNASVGELICANIIPRHGGGYRLIGTFRNEPKLFDRDKSPIHYGTFSLDIEGNANSPQRMTGHYWTDRETRGEMDAIRRTGG